MKIDYTNSNGNLLWNLYVCIYMCIYTYIHIYIYIKFNFMSSIIQKFRVGKPQKIKN